MSDTRFERRTLLAAGAAFAVAGLAGLTIPARAAGLAATASMRGGANNYMPGAPVVERIGGGGFWMSGTVLRAGDGAPLAGQRIQIWAHTTEGSERDWHSHGRYADRRQRRVPARNAADRAIVWPGACAPRKGCNKKLRNG